MADSNSCSRSADSGWRREGGGTLVRGRSSSAASSSSGSRSPPVSPACSRSLGCRGRSPVLSEKPGFFSPDGPPPRFLNPPRRDAGGRSAVRFRRVPFCTRPRKGGSAGTRGLSFWAEPFSLPSAVAVAADAGCAAGGPPAFSATAPPAGMLAAGKLAAGVCKSGNEEVSDVVSVRSGMGSMFIGKPSCPCKGDRDVARWRSACNQCNMPDGPKVESPRTRSNLPAARLGRRGRQTLAIT